MSHHISKESSVRLKELGCPQESMFCWANTEQGGELNLLRPTASFMGEENFASAFISSELGDCFLKELERAGKNVTYSLE